MTRDDHRSPGRLAPPRPDHRWGPGASAAPPRHRLANTRAEPRADRWEVVPDDDPYSVPEPYEPHSIYDSEETYAPAPVLEGTPRAGARTYPPRERPYAESRPQEYAPEAAPATTAYYEPPSRARHPAYEPDPEPETLSMQERYILLMRAIELHDDVWRLASIRANEEKDRLEAYLIPRNKRIELKQAIHRNQFMVITIDRLGNTTIKQPRREGLLRRLWHWLFGGD